MKHHTQSCKYGFDTYHLGANDSFITHQMEVINVTGNVTHCCL